MNENVRPNSQHVNRFLTCEEQRQLVNVRRDKIAFRSALCPFPSDPCICEPLLYGEETSGRNNWVAMASGNRFRSLLVAPQCIRVLGDYSVR